MRRPPLKRLAVAGSAVLVLGGAAGVYAATSTDAAQYRTARVAVGDVEESLSTTGTVDSAKRTDVVAQIDGAVASLKVAEGDKVAAGDVLAVLDRTTLRAGLVEAKATLAEARAKLVDDQQAQADAVTAKAQPASTANTPTTSSSTPEPKEDQAPSTSADDPELKKLLAQLATQQRAVTTAQSVATTALAAARTALDAQSAACADDAVSDPTSDPTDDSTSDPTSAGAGDPASDAMVTAACTQALQQVQSAQSTAADAQDALQAAITTLSGTVGIAVKSVSSAEATPAQSPEQSSNQSPAQSPDQSSEQSSDQTAPGGATVSAAQLAQDQAAIDDARAAVLRAEQELAAAVIRAPRAGRIVALHTSKGAEVKAGDTVAVLFAGKAVAVEVSLSEDQVSRVKVGQRATVRAPGSSTATAGKVTSVGSVSTATSGSPTFAATVVLDEVPTGLPSGSSARVQIVTDSVSDVVRVPVSAVRTSTSGGSVQVLVDGAPQRRRVSTGSSGAAWVEITDGLDAGERVVLADLDAEITGAGTSLQSERSGPPAGFPSGGMPGGSGVRVPR